MAEIHHFTYGWFNPVVAFLMSYLGSLLGLVCAVRSQRAPTPGRRTRWLVMATVTIGGAAVWLMRFMALLGFDVVGTPVRYDPLLTAASLILALLAVGVGLFAVAATPRSAARVLGGGVVTGLGITAMHYTGMAGVQITGDLEYDTGLLGASALIAVVAAVVALWFTVTLRGWRALVLGALVMAAAIWGMHYTAMAAVRVRLDPQADGVVGGVSPFLLIVPVTLLTSIALVGLAINALQAMTEEEFGDVPDRPHPPIDALPQPWSLRDRALHDVRTAPADRAHAPRHAEPTAAEVVDLHLDEELPEPVVLNGGLALLDPVEPDETLMPAEPVGRRRGRPEQSRFAGLNQPGGSSARRNRPAPRVLLFGAGRSRHLPD